MQTRTISYIPLVYKKDTFGQIALTSMSKPGLKDSPIVHYKIKGNGKHAHSRLNIFLKAQVILYSREDVTRGKWCWAAHTDQPTAKDPLGQCQFHMIRQDLQSQQQAVEISSMRTD